MKLPHADAVRMSGCGCCMLSRRGFMAGCAAGAAGAMGLAAMPSLARGAEGERKLKIRLAFSHTTPDVILWPNIGFDYEGRGKELQAQLTTLCPDVEFLPVRVMDAAQAAKVMEQDKDVDGYLSMCSACAAGRDRSRTWRARPADRWSW